MVYLFYHNTEIIQTHLMYGRKFKIISNFKIISMPTKYQQFLCLNGQLSIEKLKTNHRGHYHLPNSGIIL